MQMQKETPLNSFGLSERAQNVMISIWKKELLHALSTMGKLSNQCAAAATTLHNNSPQNPKKNKEADPCWLSLGSPTKRI